MIKDMLRALLFFFMLFLTILAFLELFSVLPDSFGSVEQTSALLSLLGIFALMAAFWVVGHTRFMTKLFFRPLMVSYRKALRHSGRKPSLKHQDFFRALAKRVSETALDDRQTPASLLSDARVGINLNELSWPWDFPELEWWAKNAAERINSHLLLRFLLSDQLKAITKRLHLLQLYAARFPKSRPVQEDEEPRSSETQSLVEAIEQYTGANILAEGHDTRSGVSRVRLWHSNAMGISAESVDKEKVLKYRNFRQFHRPNLTKERATLLCAHDQKMRENEKYRTGDFDRHLVVARGVTVIANNETGEVEFLISSHSTCYAASDHSPARCKGALHEMSFGPEPVLLWERSKGITSRRTSADNSVLMESIISLHIVLIIVDKEGNRSILFIERGTGSRFGNGIWSLPGAVLNMPSGQIPLKTHEFGGIDIPSQLIEKLHEVLGLEVSASTMQPTQVFMVNQRESRSTNNAQFVTTVGFLANFMAEKTDIEAALHRAKRKGGTAVEGFQLIPLSSKQRPSKDPAHEFVKRLHQRRAELDQMSMTAALNIAAIEYGTASVEQAIRTVSKSMSETWQNTRWLGEDKSMKIVGPGRTLL